MFRQRVLDLYDDQGELLRRYPREQVLNVAKTAMALPPEVADELPIDSFALVLRDGDGYHRKFATADRGNTALSILYFLETGLQLPADVQKLGAANLCWAAERYGVPVPEALQKLAAEQPPQLPIVDLTNRPLPSFEKRAEPLGFREIQKAAARADYDIWRMHPRDRRAFARELVKAAEHTGIDVAAVETSYGGDSYGDQVDVAVRGRYHYLKHAEARHAYELLLSRRGQMPAEKFAEFLTELDEFSQIDHLWDSSVTDPYQSTFLRRQATWAREKQAAQDPVVEERGLSVRQSALRKLAEAGSSLSAILDEPTFSAYQADPVGTFRHVPYPLQQIIAQHAGV